MLVAACAGLTVAPESRADDRDIGARLQACASCHGDGGRTTQEGSAPALAGRPDAYLYEQLRSFRDHRRPHGLVQQMLAFLSDDYLREIAAYYAAQASGAKVREKQLLAADRAAAP